MESQCNKLRKEYEELKALKDEFVLELEQVSKTGDLKRGKELKAELKQRHDALKEKVWLLKWEKFDRYYLKQVERKHHYQVIETLKGHTDSVYILQVLPDGRIVSGSDEKGHKIKEIEKDKEGNIRESHE